MTSDVENHFKLQIPTQSSEPVLPDFYSMPYVGNQDSLCYINL